MPFSHNLIWKVNDSDDLLMTQINKPRESWHRYSLRWLSEVKWQYYFSQSALKERDSFCFNCMSGLCCELCWLVMPLTTCFVHRFSVPLFCLKLTTVYMYLEKKKKKKEYFGIYGFSKKEIRLEWLPSVLGSIISYSLWLFCAWTTAVSPSLR